MTGYDVTRLLNWFSWDSVIHKLQRCAHWSIASTGLDFIFCPDMTSEDYESNDQVSGEFFWEKVTFALRGGGGWMNIYLPCIYAPFNQIVFLHVDHHGKNFPVPFITQTVLSLLTNLPHFSRFIQHGCARKDAQPQLSGIASAVLQTITQMRSSRDNIKRVPAKLIVFYLSKCEWSLSSHFLQCCVSEWHFIFFNFLSFWYNF